MTKPPNVGRAVKEALANDGEGHVIAVFSRASYVDVGGHVFALLSTSESSGPLHARVTEPPSVRLGDEAAVVSGQLFIGGRTVELPAACWDPDPLPNGAPIASMLGRVLRHEPVLDLGSKGLSSLEESLNAAWSDGGIVMACQGLFGRGIGLTPTGDDVAAGLMIAHSMLGLSDDATRLAMVADAPTHAISRAFLASAARGQSIDPLHRLLAACAAEEIGFARVAREDLAAIGHTSGLDLAYGVLIGLRWASAGISEARPARRMTRTALAQTTA